MKITNDKIEVIPISIDKLDYVLGRMFPNIVGGYHYLGQGKLNQETMTQVEESIITMWQVENEEVPKKEKILEVWEVVKSHYDRQYPNNESTFQFAEPLKSTDEDLAKDPLDNNE